MASKTITAANAKITLSVDTLFPSPVQLQGFSADNVYDTDQMRLTETQMGVDGHLAGGAVLSPISQNFSLMADSDSCTMFETWYATQRQRVAAYVATGWVTLLATGVSYQCVRGFLQDASPLPAAGRVLAARRFLVMWENIIPNPVS